MVNKLVQTLTEFESEAARFANSLTPNQQNATLVTFSGELGAGKTTFIKVVAHVLGVEEVVTSPTFIIEKIYLLPNGKPFKHLIHIDAYRLSQGSELTALDFNELMRDTDNLVLFEWPEKVADILVFPALRIFLTVLLDGSRIISYD